MQRSIAELCLIDHRNDPLILERRLSNKTSEIFKSWIRPGNALLVAIQDGKILAVGRVTEAGESPSTTFRRRPDFVASVPNC